MGYDTTAIRGDFPVLDRSVEGAELIYFDNAATTQTPEQVYGVYEEFYREYNANVHRGIHTLSHEASVAYEEAHDRVASFVGASGGRKEVVFTKNTTESINLVAYGLGMNELGDGDEIVATEMDHHASLVTWQQIAKETGADIRYIEVRDDGRLDVEHAKSVIGDDTAVLAVPHVSNVLGTINPVEELASVAHEHDAYVLVDGAQSVPTRPVDVEALDADFFTFSGHKMAGPTGIGGLYGKRSLLEDMEPFLYGGEMIRHVSLRDSTWNDPPWKFEAGTPPIAEGIALAAAVDYLEEIGMETVRRHENELAQYALERLAARDDIETYGPPPGRERAGLVAFNVDGVHGHDLSSLLNERGIAVRAGDHCTQPLHDALGVPGSVRASFYVYNTTDEIDEMLAVIDRAADDLPRYLASDRYHDSVFEHYRRPDDGVELDGDERTLTITASEMTCGDEAEFALRLTPDRRIERVSFAAESCAVSRAVASLLTAHVEGMTLREVVDSDGLTATLLDGQFPALRRDCVLGPEDVLRDGIERHLERTERVAAGDSRTTHR